MNITAAAKIRQKLVLFSMAAASLLAIPHTAAEPATPAERAPPAEQEEQENEAGIWQRSMAHLGDIARQGEWNLYLSGYAHHLRRSYSEKSRRVLNEKAWGAGFGKTLRNANGDDESLYFIGLRDSRRHAQWMAGYAYKWVHGFDTGLEVGAGLTALMIRRQGLFGGVPFPGILPVASIGTQGVKLMATFIPHVAIRNNKGNVVLLFARFELK
jgi:hypothetical protein